MSLIIGSLWWEVRNVRVDSLAERGIWRADSVWSWRIIDAGVFEICSKGNGDFLCMKCVFPFEQICTAMPGWGFPVGIGREQQAKEVENGYQKNREYPRFGILSISYINKVSGEA